MAIRREPGSIDAAFPITLPDGTTGYAAAVVTVTENGAVASGGGGSGGGASGPQLAASSQSVTPATDGNSFHVDGNVADGAADSGNSVKAGGVYGGVAALASPATAAGQRAPLQMDALGLNIRVAPVPGGNVTPTDGVTAVQVMTGRGSNALAATAFPAPVLNYVWTGTTGVMSRGDTSGAYVVRKGGGNIATAQVAIGTSAALVAAARAGRQNITITSTAATVFYYGAAGVTTTTGAYVAAAAGASVTLDTATAVYAVGAAALTVSVTELY